MQDQLQSLLDQIKAIIKEENDLKQSQYDSGEIFNVFEVLRLQRNEVRLHSSFIATLLDPQGSHGLKTKPLKSFLQAIEATEFLTDLPSVKVEKELTIGKITKNGEEGGRMDIVLIDNKKNAIVIENKIDAKDQSKQLLRYYNYSRKHFNNYRIYYLTKWGENASNESCGGKDIDYKKISYNEHILTWLNDCIELSEKIQPVNETIKQYRTNLLEILNIMSQKSEKKLLTVATSKSNIESTLGFWFAIQATDKSRITKTILQNLEQQWGKKNPKNKKIDMPYGYDYFWSESGEDASGSWWKCDDLETLRAMSDGSFLAFIEKEILKKTVELKLLEELEYAII